MNKEKSFIQLLTMHTMILLIPVIVISFLVVFLYFNKLENEFEELNTETMETANVCMDAIMDETLAVYHQMSQDSDVHTFLVSEFASDNERVSVLKNIQENVRNALIKKDSLVYAYIYSNVNDVFIGNDSVWGWQEYYERFFTNSDYTYEEIGEILENAKTTPVWMVTDDYLIYCINIKVSGRTKSGIFLATIKKQELLDTLWDVCDNFEMGFCLSYRGEELLMQTEGFSMEAYEASKGADGTGYRYRNYLVNKYSSQSVGGLEYVYTIDYESFGGNIAQMVRSLVLIILIIVGVSVILSRREMKRIRAMYVDVLEENVSLETHLNLQVERLNRQQMLNALRGYEFLSFEKQPVQIGSSRIRVLIFQFAASDDFDSRTEERKDIADVVRKCLVTEQTECVYLYEKEAGYICVLGYEEEEKLYSAIDKLSKTLKQSCGSGIHIGLSTEINDIANLSEAYERAGTALQYCITLHEESGLVQYSDIMELEKAKIYYPPEKEKQLLRSIRLGMREETENCLKHIYQVNFEERHLSKGAVRQLLVRMLNTVYELIDVVYSGEVEKYDEFGRVSRKILQIDNVDSAFDILHSIALSICGKCSVRKEGELRDRIIAYINENFTDQDLSLEKMASDFEMSYYHLSRLFNEYMQMNFASYLTGVRLDYSRELLRTTTCSVEQVATQSGFLQSNSFIRAFKKYYGVTPGKYREEKQVHK